MSYIVSLTSNKKKVTDYLSKIYIDGESHIDKDYYSHMFLAMKFFFEKVEFLEDLDTEHIKASIQMSYETSKFFENDVSFNIETAIEYINILIRYNAIDENKTNQFSTIKNYIEKCEEKIDFSVVFSCVYLIFNNEERFSNRLKKTFENHFDSVFEKLLSFDETYKIERYDYMELEELIIRTVIHFYSYDEIYKESIYVKIDDEEFYSYQNANEIVVNKDILKIDSEKLLPIGSTIYFNTGSSYKGRLYVVIDIDKRCGTLFHHLSAIY